MKPQPVDLKAYLGRRSPLEPYLGFLLKGAAAPVIFDIGACEGEDSIRYARLFPEARVFSFEPLPGNQEILRANCAKYGTDAELIPVALSDRRGEAAFYVSAGRPPDLFLGENWNYGNKSSSLLAPTTDKMHGWVHFPERITVPCETLDEFCRSRRIARIDFIHMDVQGAEGLVLDGARSMMPRIGAIWMEVSNEELYRGQKLRGEIEATMRRRGFLRAYVEDRGVEGDQLFINARRGRNLLWLALRRLGRLGARLACGVTPRSPPP